MIYDHYGVIKPLEDKIPLTFKQKSGIEKYIQDADKGYKYDPSSKHRNLMGKRAPLLGGIEDFIYKHSRSSYRGDRTKFLLTLRAKHNTCCLIYGREMYTPYFSLRDKLRILNKFCKFISKRNRTIYD